MTWRSTRRFSTNASSNFDFHTVEVTPRNFIRLLQRDECVLLFPGGVSGIESWQRRKQQVVLAGERDFVQTPSSSGRLEADFVRAAAKFDALIVPFGSFRRVGAADSADF